MREFFRYKNQNNVSFSSAKKVTLKIKFFANSDSECEKR